MNGQGQTPHEVKIVKMTVRALEETCTHRDSIAKVIIVPPEPTRGQRMAIVEASGTLSFWDEPEEDVYSTDDGKLV